MFYSLVLFVSYTKKGGSSFEEPPLSAEREGFEPPVPLGTAVFKTAVIDHSTTFPWSDLGGARTLDPMIKSHLLYQLSYQVSITKILTMIEVTWEGLEPSTQ